MLEADPTILRVRINPANRRIRITDPTYRERWTAAFEKIRAELEADFTGQVAMGDITPLVDSKNPLADTPERAIHFLAHAAAETTMQDWALVRGIGMAGVDRITTHNRTIMYELDSSIPVLDYQIAA
jgi:hypothetical protein